MEVVPAVLQRDELGFAAFTCVLRRLRANQGSAVGCVGSTHPLEQNPGLFATRAGFRDVPTQPHGWGWPGGGSERGHGVWAPI